MLTKKQKTLLDYLNSYIKKNGISPSFEEMKNAVNLKSKSGIHRLVVSLEQRGEFISIPLSFISPNNQYFGLKVKGLSMIENGIYDGDIAIIKKTNDVQNGNIAAVLTIDNEVTLKTVKIENSKIHLIPANKNYKVKIFNLPDVQVQGILSGLIRKYN